ncbi:hypothetical protein QJS04_geneDACA015613 [Acorus gramineus]|uniref:Uncharacterized protein n=1 Tax=Acorus gramineus TaxID=55184 RepID=A0AAV9ASE7_ACOGR|nr:hypothetical protein QJS04_geneDACA015613 [Acorus gramineus]
MSSLSTWLYLTTFHHVTTSPPAATTPTSPLEGGTAAAWGGDGGCLTERACDGLPELELLEEKHL